MNDKSTSFRNKGYICTAKKKADDGVRRLKLEHLMGLRAPPNVAKKRRNHAYPFERND